MKLSNDMTEDFDECLKMLSECEFMDGQCWSDELKNDVDIMLSKYGVPRPDRKDVRGELP